MTEDPRIALVTQAVDAFNTQDVPALLTFIHPDGVSHVSPGLANPGTWQGVEGYAKMMVDWSEAFSELHVDVKEIELVDDTHVLVHAAQTGVGAGSGAPVELDVVFMVELAGEQAIRFEIHPDRDSAMEAV